MFRLCLFGCALIAGTFAANAQTDKLAWGKYLTEEVARCQECHTGKTSDGQLDRAHWMKGAVLDVVPIQPIKNWHKSASDLTRTSGLWVKWGDAAVVKFLMTGKNPKGNLADLPMPAYTLKQSDAEAIVEYLKSLN